MFDRQRIEALPEQRQRAGTGKSALEGVRVVDFTHFVAGPLATMILADFGADVVKVEAPGKGDDFRYYPPIDPALEAQGAPYLWTNRNKRSIAIDLKSPEGVELALDLIKHADLVVENFSSGVMERLGLGYQACLKVNPRIIYCSVSAYARSGPFADRLGFDPVAQAESGFLSMNGYADREGVRTSATVMDNSTALLACNAILMALFARERTGEGQAVEVSLFDSAVLMAGFAAMQHLTTGYEPGRNGNTSPDTCPTGVFRCSDRAFYINCGNNKIFSRIFNDVLQRPDIGNDPDLLDRSKRLAARDRLFAIMNEAFGQHPWSYWKPKLRAAGVPNGEVRTLAEALRSEEVASRGLVERIPHPRIGWIPNIASPIRMSGTPAVAARYAPAVGEDTVAVLRDVLGYDDAKVRATIESGCLGVVPQEQLTPAQAARATQP